MPKDNLLTHRTVIDSMEFSLKSKQLSTSLFVTFYGLKIFTEFLSMMSVRAECTVDDQKKIANFVCEIF